MTMIQFLSRSEVADFGSNHTAVLFDVSSYGKKPYSLLSPFCYDKRYSIPVPAQPHLTSYSVEGIWQGLKFIDGVLDFTQFSKRPQKRKGNVLGHLLGEEIIDIVEARKKIYIPSYIFYLNEYAPKDALDSIMQTQRSGASVYLYDVEDNGNVMDCAPYAHAAVLATYLNLKILNSKLTPKNREEDVLYNIIDANVPLEDRLVLLKSVLHDEGIRKAFEFRCVEHPQNPDDFHLASTLGYSCPTAK